MFDLYTGDALEVIRTLPAASAHCCVTSPPYYGLRDYGTAQWNGGDPDCDHQGEPVPLRANINQNTGTGTDHKNAECRKFFRSVCEKCGAVRIDKQIGLEETPESYVARLVEVFREVRRVLRDDGTLWLNLGDSYATRSGPQPPANTRNSCGHTAKTVPTGYKRKDLMGIPWMVAFALQADGWYLRQDIVWHKPNCMPESATDRCTKSHEYVFLLSKSEKYYFDHEAIKEPAGTKGNSRTFRGGGAYTGSRSFQNSAKCLRESTGNVPNATGLRNKRSVWTIPTVGYKEAHFAVFPPDLVRPCILAGCPEGGTVLDPFTGSGTTGLVALQCGRGFVGIELNPEYVEMAEKRVAPLAMQVRF